MSSLTTKHLTVIITILFLTISTSQAYYHNANRQQTLKYHPIAGSTSVVHRQPRSDEPPSNELNKGFISAAAREESLPLVIPADLGPEETPNDAITVAECRQDSLRQDFGTACLKKVMHQAPVESVKPNPVPNTLIPPKTRYFSVKPMMKKTSVGGFKTPAQTARQLYASKGYHYPTKSAKWASPVLSNRLAPLSPVKFYQTAIEQAPEPLNGLDGAVIEQKTTEDDEWAQVVQQEEENSINLPPEQQIHLPATSTQFEEELELLQSLKRSLGILSAQALNIKQRTVMLYRESKRRKLTFFDTLLTRTHSYISEKQDETRNAISDIDETISQIRQHQQISSLNSLRRTLYLNEQERYPSGMAKPPPKTPQIDQKEIDQLMVDALAHAKRMMTIIRELNDALDEFEDQFNLPRFEPNSIDDGVRDEDF